MGRSISGHSRRVLVVLLLLFGSVPAHATENEIFPIDDADPVRDVPTQAEADARPLDFAYYLQELAARADAATARGDHGAAVRYYRALARAVPDSSLPREKLSASLQALDVSDAATRPEPRPSRLGLAAGGAAAILAGLGLLLSARRRPRAAHS
jgi:hypothetical protein